MLEGPCHGKANSSWVIEIGGRNGRQKTSVENWRPNQTEWWRCRGNQKEGLRDKAPRHAEAQQKKEKEKKKRRHERNEKEKGVHLSTDERC